MATESYPEVIEGTLSNEATVVNAIADEIIEMWSPVIRVAVVGTEDLPRVEPVAGAHNVDVMGVVVGPLRDSTNGYAATAAGELVNVCVFGRCKIRVDGTVNIDIGDSLVTHDTKGIAQKANFTIATQATDTINAALKALASVIATALKASTTDGDIIPCFVNKVAGDSVDS